MVKKKYQKILKKLRYNMPKIGFKHSQESKDKIKEKRKFQTFSIETRKKLSKIHMGHIVTKETRDKISKSKKGKKYSQIARNNMRLGQLGSKQSQETIEKRRLKNIGQKRSEAFKLRMAEMRIGSKSHLWKGGITPINLKIRMTLKYRLWRESVFKRDNWTCVWCK